MNRATLLIGSLCFLIGYYLPREEPPRCPGKVHTSVQHSDSLACIYLPERTYGRAMKTRIYHRKSGEWRVVSAPE